MAQDDQNPKPTSIRLDPDVRRRLEEFAARERRSISSAVNYLLDQALTDTNPNH